MREPIRIQLEDLHPNTNPAIPSIPHVDVSARFMRLDGFLVDTEFPLDPNGGTVFSLEQFTEKLRILCERSNWDLYWTKLDLSDTRFIVAVYRKI